MDNMYVIGYRIDAKVPYAVDEMLLDEWMDAGGIDADGLPGSQWMYWPSSEHLDSDDHRIISFWLMDGRLQADYRCPIDRAELWQDMHEQPFDVPSTYEADVAELKATDMYKFLVANFLERNVDVKWGLALMQG